MAPYMRLIEQSKDYDNVHIYWLYDEDFVFNIANYKDLTHYHYKINSLQLDFIKQHSHIININNYKQKIQTFKKQVKKIDLRYYIKQIQKIENISGQKFF